MGNIYDIGIRDLLGGSMTEKEEHPLVQLTNDFEQKLGRPLKMVELDLLRSIVTSTKRITN